MVHLVGVKTIALIATFLKNITLWANSINGEMTSANQQIQGINTQIQQLRSNNTVIESQIVNLTNRLSAHLPPLSAAPLYNRKKVAPHNRGNRKTRILRSPQLSAIDSTQLLPKSSFLSPAMEGLRHKRDVAQSDRAMSPGGPLTVLTDDASVQTNSSAYGQYQTNIMESGLISPTLGLVMEQTGTYMEYSGYIYVPIIYHMPHLASIGLIGQGVDCNLTANLPHHEIIVKLLKDKIGTLIPQNRHSRRSKRFLATLLIGGVAGWNRASIWSLQDTVQSLDDQLQAMQEHQQIVTESVNTLIDNQHAIYHAVDRQARIISEFMEKSSCKELVTNYFREVYSTWLSLAPNDFARVVDSALSGKITPDLLPATDVLNVLLKHPSLASTAYTEDMTLLYELGKLSLHQVSYDPYPMVSGVMVFPKILTDRSAALMRVHATHSHASSGYRKIILPDVVACKVKGNCWEISPTTCKESLTLTLCPKQTKIDFNMCLKHIIADNVPTDQCEWSLASDVSLEVISFDGGVLVSSSNQSGEIMVTQGKELVVIRTVEPSAIPYVLTSKDGDYFHINNQIYQLAQETLKTGYEVVINVTVPVQKEALEDLRVDGWVSESHVPLLRAVPWSPPSHYTWWTAIGSIICILGLVVIVIIYRAKVVKLGNAFKQEVAGWITIPSAPPNYSLSDSTREPARVITV